MTDTEILNQLVKIASLPTDTEPWADERDRQIVEAVDGFWRGLIQALHSRRLTPVPADRLSVAAADGQETTPAAAEHHR